MATYEELLQENSELRGRIAEQERRIERQERRIEQLEKIIEELRRGGKRQAAPFSKGEPKSHPQTPGRKPAERYGQRACRSVPELIDEIFEVDCPSRCETCQSPVLRVGQEIQYQIDLPEIRPRTTEFILHYGECSRCGRRQIGRHPLQSSSAVGVAGVQIGPRVVSLAAYLNKVGGLSYGKIAGLLEQMAGLRVSRSTLCRALLRTAKKAQPIYEELVQAIRGSAVVYPDESGWRIGDAVVGCGPSPIVARRSMRLRGAVGSHKRRRC
jgi:transposase